MFVSQNLIMDERIYESKHVRLLSVSFHFHRSWPQDDLDAVERTRTVASGEAAGNESSTRSRYLPRINLAERRKASKGKCRREWERKTADPQISINSRVLSPIWYSCYVLAVSSSSSSSLVSDSFGTCSPASVTLGCLVDGVFCAVERHNDTRQKLSMLHIRHIGFHACIRRVQSL